MSHRRGCGTLGGHGSVRGEEGGALTQAPASTDYWVQANEDAAEAAYRMADLAHRMPQPLALKPLVFPSQGVSLVGVLVGFDLSDAAQFWLAGARGLFPFPAGDKPAWYHTPGDTPAQVDADRLERIGRIWAATLAAFATASR